METVISLAPNLFYGTTIAVTILVLARNKTDTAVQFIDASGEEFFAKKTNNNIMDDDHIKAIIKMFDNKADVAHVAETVAFKKIAENDYNLSVSAYVAPRDTRERIGKQLRTVWNASSLQTAQAEPGTLVASYREKHPGFADWLENNIPEGLAVFSLPEAHRKRMRTSNGIERPIQQELKRRTVKVRVFPNLDC